MRTIAQSAEAICSEPSFGDALIAGISHTDVGLTLATLVLAACTLLLIDDKRMDRIHQRFTHVTHPFRNVHAVKDEDRTEGNAHTITHTELTMTEGEN